MSKTRTSTAPLESILVDWMRDRRSGTLRFEDADGLPHTLSLIDGIRVIVGAPASSGTGPDHRRSQAYHAADILFRKSASAPQITLDPKRPVPPPDAVSLDAFEVLYRGVRARYASSPPRATVTASDAPFVLHAEADLDVFPLRPGEEKLVAHLRNLSRSLEDLRAKAFLPDDELVTFLHFLLVTHNVFRLGEDTSHLEPLGEISPEERLLREPRDDDAAKLSPFASRLGLAILGLALAPLGLHLLSGDDIPSRIVQTTHTTPEIARHVAMSDERLRDLLRVVPGGKLEGALFPHDSHAHWALAGAALIGFLALSAFVFRRGRASPGDLLKAALITGTVGALILLGIPWIGDRLQGFGAIPTGIVGVVAVVGITLVKLVAFSYRAAADPANGLLLSFVGFTVGVGLCEEVVKIMPITGHYRAKGTLDAHGALAWGLASGAGLGVSEGVLYAASYNGVALPLTYLVRFISCVALHAIWTGSAALAVHARRTQIHPRANGLERLTTLLQVIAAPMVLHGLYDTLLKRHQDLPAFGVALASFGYLLFRVSRSGIAPPAPLSAPAAS